MKAQHVNKLQLFIYRLYLLIFFGYLLAPLVLVVILAFNDSSYPSLPWRGFTLRWFQELFGDTRLLISLWNSLRVALVVSVLSVFVGTATSFALVRHKFPGKGLFYALAIGPIVTPGVILGVSLLIGISNVEDFAYTLQEQGNILGSWLIALYKTKLFPGLGGVVLGQASFIISFVILTVSARLRKFDMALEEAAMDLGASRLGAVRRITIPFLKPALIASGILAFLLSFDNFNTTIFLVGNESTLPIHIFSMLRFGITPKINAISVVLIVVTVVLGFLSDKFNKQE
ncbi:MAG: ABC transporter permease [bacterium]|nr:ABC transporter permease [bacterium]